MKRCPGCDTEKPLEAFGSDKKRHDGRCAYCKPCRNERARLDYAADPQKIIDRNDAWRRENGRGDRSTEYENAKQAPGYQARKRKNVRAHQERHPDRARARWRASSAIRRGLLVRPDTCSKCHQKPPEIRPGVSEIQFDHCFGYSPENALRGQWLCRPLRAAKPL